MENEVKNKVNEVITAIEPKNKRPWSIAYIEAEEWGLRNIEYFNEDWAISEDGDLLGLGYYLISSYRLNEGNWLLHLMGKVWFDANTFIPAYFEACRRAGLKSVKVTIDY